jgi:hypothetical protein
VPRAEFCRQKGRLLAQAADLQRLSCGRKRIDPGICLRLWLSRGRERSNAGQHLVKLGG